MRPPIPSAAGDPRRIANGAAIGNMLSWFRIYETPRGPLGAARQTASRLLRYASAHRVAHRPQRFREQPWP